MTWINVLAMLVWTGAGAVLLYFLMFVDSLFTRYKDLAEIKNGNIAVTIRFIMKLFAQGYILATSISTSNDLLEALFISVISFIILLLVEWVIRLVLKATAGLNLAEGTHQGKVSHALLAGSLHLVGALIIAAGL